MSRDRRERATIRLPEKFTGTFLARSLRSRLNPFKASGDGYELGTFISNEIAGFVLGKNVLRESGGVGGLSGGVAAAALVFERTAAGASGVASHVLGLA